MGEIEVWRIAVTPANSAAAASLAPRVLDAAEQRKAAAFRRPADQDLYRIAHVALRILLADRLHRPAAELRFRQAACPGCGKPHGRPEVVSDEPLEFSLSHTTGLALIALAPDTVGLDVERLAAFGAATDIAGQLHPAEQAELAAVAADLRPAATLRCWVRKEAYLKGTGMGLGAGTDADYVGLGPGYPAHPATPPPGWVIQSVPVPDAYDAAIALRTDAPAPLPLTVRDLDLGPGLDRDLDLGPDLGIGPGIG
ncbi:4'-phosphopantetheinyl transferase superfamily protein [Kitasatospora acidiphila]|uniref:4'-phosphopantetheinyl transferase superfamily protein n=1 Tax=Kitasatospora acidiphila TaxID=2567942 RepID=A0A540W2F8_9ACTN|nr:4'-phosphopantetheinyl transferase superfamily protein [Kitasatospora acidiphila]TQF03182.1 4'-phosphopantetheinyl transferase superfamily protein [Kitasatospora acidiphila]